LCISIVQLQETKRGCFMIVGWPWSVHNMNKQYLNLAISRIISRFFASNWLMSSLCARDVSKLKLPSDGARPWYRIKKNIKHVPEFKIHPFLHLWIFSLQNAALSSNLLILQFWCSQLEQIHISSLSYLTEQYPQMNISHFSHITLNS
jgi:hypothetical protein